MTFQVGIGSLDRTVFFQVGLCTPLRTMAEKLSVVTPLCKSDEKSLINNHRPISVLNVLSKLIKCIVHQQLFEYLEKTNFFVHFNLASIEVDERNNNSTYKLHPFQYG